LVDLSEANFVLTVDKAFGAAPSESDFNMWPEAISTQPQATDGAAGFPDMQNQEYTNPINLDQDLRGRRQHRLTTAYAKLHEYSTASHPSRPPSPRSARAYERYLQELGSIEPVTYDPLVINVFIGIFQTHVVPTFSCFDNFRIGSTTPEEVYLAMAAAGGLYCTVPGSEKMAKGLYHVARRKLLTFVCLSRRNAGSTTRIESLDYRLQFPAGN